MILDDEEVFGIFMEQGKMQLRSETEEWKEAYEKGYSAGYAARDKLSCASCGDMEEPIGK